MDQKEPEGKLRSREKTNKKALTRVAVKVRIVVRHVGNVMQLIYRITLRIRGFSENVRSSHDSTSTREKLIHIPPPPGTPNVLFCRFFPKFIICENPPKVT